MSSKLLFKIPTELEPVEVGQEPVVELGMKETLDVVYLVASIVDAVKKAKADGKINLIDLPLLYEPGKKLLKAIEGYQLIPAELEGIDLSEAEEIVKAVQEEFGFESEQAKAFIEDVFKAAYHTKRIVEYLV